MRSFSFAIEIIFDGITTLLKIHVKSRDMAVLENSFKKKPKKLLSKIDPAISMSLNEQAQHPTPLEKHTETQIPHTLKICCTQSILLVSVCKMFINNRKS